MERIFLSLYITIFIVVLGKSQCPDLSNNVQVNGTNDFDFSICFETPLSFTVDDIYLPTGTIDWYSSSTSGFDPLIEGTLLGSSAINSNNECQECPRIEVIYIDACDNDAINEFAVVSSGSGLFIDDLSISFDTINNFGSPSNGDINVGGICEWNMGDLSLVEGCSAIVSVGPGDYIPPNSILIIQTSDLGSITYDFSGVCSTSECIYVVKNSCQRTVGAFTNCNGSTSVTSNRVNTLNLACGCSDVLTYDILDSAFLAICTVEPNGMHVFADLSYANNSCFYGPILESIPQFTFSAVVDTFSYTFSDAECNTEQFIVGVLNSDQYSEECCEKQITEEYSYYVSCAEAQLSGGGILCAGDCMEVDVLFDGGKAPYELNMEVSGSTIPTLVDFEVDEKIIICYDTGEPPFVPETNTANIPGMLGGFLGALEILSFTDANDCDGMIIGSPVSIEFIDEGPDCATSSLNIENKLNVLVYPNPTLNFINISGNFNEVNVTVFDLLSKVVFEEKITDKIDISHLENGVYFLKISDGQKTSSHKITKI